MIVAILALLFNFFYESLFINSAWPLDSEQSAQTAVTDKVGDFEQALKNVEAQKTKERKELTQKYKEKLNLMITNWLSQREAQKKSQMNGVIAQNWDKLPKEFNFNVLHYDYYLRGFYYSIVSSDVKETESLTSPIKGSVVILEKIYAEKYHTPDISNVDPYFFTVTTAITLNLEYHQDDFIITGINNNITGIINDCPDELKKLRI